MSQLALQSREAQSDLHQPLRSPARTSPTTTAPSDSPTIGRVQIPYPAAATTTTNNGPPTSSSTYRSQRKPAPSPLQTTTAISPPSSVSPTRQHFPSAVHDLYNTNTVPEIVTTSAHESASGSYETSYYYSDSSREPTPDTRAAKPARAPVSPRLPNDTRNDSDFALTSKPSGGTSPGLSSTMASRTDSIGAPRNASIDSTMSAASSNKAMEDTTDIASLIKTAGSAEAVIQYLLKEKKSQAQQNTQLWRLVDKQRAMILGLNKDLERALKEKEKYRKKLKELANDVPPLPAVPPLASQSAPPPPRIEVDTAAKPQALEIPVSPGLDSDSHRHSPIDVAMAPYPITPPADQPMIPNGPPSAVGELLDPSHAMPRPSEHALDQFDHDAEEHAAEVARRHADDAKDIPFNLGLPPSRSVPSEPPRMPPPMPPPQIPAPSPPQQTPIASEDIAQFPTPPAPQTRKAPPAPLRLGTEQSPTVPADEELDSDSDFDDILEVEEIKDEKRGRRRTRQEDEQERAIFAKKEAEMRSLSKKSNSQPGTPKAMPERKIPASPRIDQDLSSLSGMLDLRAPALLTPGLPASPRSAMAPRSPLTSPPLSPMGVSGFPSMPLSPRPPRQPIPLPPNTPVQTPSPPGEAPALTSPKPLNIVKKFVEAPRTASPEKLAQNSPTERTRIYKGLVTEEYPDLLIPPNALPSVDIKVASSRMKPSRASLLSLTQLEEDPVFTLAIFFRADGGELWRVEKDTSSLAKLDQRLKQFSAFTAKTPDRSLFTGHAPAKLDARRVALNQYFADLLETPFDTTTALELCKFLSHNTLPPNADETGTSLNEGVSEVTQKTGPGGRPYRSGYLTKRGKNFGGWKARFFVLDGPHLKYYETPGGAHLGTIKLQKAQIGKQSQHNGDGQSPARNSATDDVDNQYRHAFLILEPKKKDPSSLTKHVLCAESDRERDQWVDALLRWIDYKDPEDEDHAKADAPHDRQGSSGSDRVHPKKKGQARQQHPQQPYHPNDSEDTLIGVSYETMRQGDIPQGAPGKSAHHDYPGSSQQSLAISAPRDPQVISNSETWGSKLSMAPPPSAQLAPPNLEEKKARKRSFFGFGPKARTSSDGQDSLFGGDGGSTGSGSAGNQYSGPVRQVFGASLAEAVRFNPPVDVRVPLPAVVYRCIQYLDAKNAISEEGIFRLSGSNVVIKQLRERFNNESDINLLSDETYYDIHAVASLLKLYLRELPTTILTRDLHLEFLTVTEMTDQRAKIAGLAELVQRLPQANATLLKYLIAFLIKIINNADVNKMTVRNVGIVFSPTLNIPAPVFALFLQNYEPIFGIDPTEYELPSPGGDNERRPSLPTDRPSFGDRRPSDSQRPSTSGTGSSPHRQRLMDAMREGQGARSSPTPPPMNMQQMAHMNAMRTTPTPPPQRPMNYEPQYLAQQSQIPNNRMSMRPSYESNFMLPQGYDPSQLHAPPGRANPGYDRPLYESNGASGYDQPYMKARRESGVFMGNLNHQGSKSRLREEARY
ncbi:RhoGAP-domain-containing protein [Thozetella sp. PMI_491]|nr:RhoGAP-domain-containing protein [Thozetella sp. PMI_491]